MNARKSYLVGSKWCHAQFDSKEESDNYRFTHEQHALHYLRELEFVPQRFFCRIGIHSMREHGVRDGGGVITYWGYCIKCHACHWIGKAVEGKRNLASSLWRRVLKCNETGNKQPTQRAEGE